ncbi:biotin--[acetyl-CoA-carboxylase] ligase [bacterium]|jgi:BirA family transcriptional regulator, biotin operon repressor / biotin---[acetyl-CoA-carboxylase] ligase|nr:biotin--[acetyl-CoA-carboxylase] ligase [bacterium]
MSNWFNCEKLLLSKQRTLYLLDEVPSTNDFLLGRLSKTEATVCRMINHQWNCSSQIVSSGDIESNSLAIARVQTAGRGRQGRTWFDGGLQMSWDIDCDVVAQGLSVWVGVVVAFAIRNLTSKNVMLKWPNDLFFENKKLGGILLDRICNSKESKLVAGIGLNCSYDLPDELNASTLIDFDAESLASTIINEHDKNLKSFTNGGWSVWRKKFEEIDFLAGKEVTVEAGALGLASGIADSGALILKMSDGSSCESFASETHITEMK